MSGRVIYFSTTNGTPALRQAFRGSARPVYLAALVNLSAVSAAVAGAAATRRLKRVLIICAGCHGQTSLEDFYCAGLMAQRLPSEFAESGISYEFSDDAVSAAEYSRMNRDKPLVVLAASEHGRYLKDIGFAADLEFASQVDKYTIAPYFDGKRVII
jgi:2-phosphosulfolactate phosphatase